MPGMIEKIAREIARHEGLVAGEAADFAEWHWEEFVDHARGILGVMREPTEAMLAAEVVAYNDHSKKQPRALLAGECLWRAMIDAAIAEPTR